MSNHHPAPDDLRAQAAWQARDSVAAEHRESFVLGYLRGHLHGEASSIRAALLATRNRVPRWTPVLTFVSGLAVGALIYWRIQ